jgi:hypothetical protein
MLLLFIREFPSIYELFDYYVGIIEYEVWVNKRKNEFKN